MNFGNPLPLHISESVMIGASFVLLGFCESEYLNPVFL